MKKIWASIIILCHLTVTSASAIAYALEDVATHTTSGMGYEAPHVHNEHHDHANHQGETEEEHAKHAHEHEEGCHAHLLFQPSSSHVFLSLPIQREVYDQAAFDSDSQHYSPDVPPPNA